MTQANRPAGRGDGPAARLHVRASAGGQMASSSGPQLGLTTSTAQQARPVRTRPGPVPPPWGLRHRPMRRCAPSPRCSVCGPFASQAFYPTTRRSGGCLQCNGINWLACFKKNLDAFLRCDSFRPWDALNDRFIYSLYKSKTSFKTKFNRAPLT